MKKVILLFAFVLGNFCFVFAQTKKTNVSDTIPYHFSLKNDWALKLNALQPFVVGEFRFGLEKRIKNYSSLEFQGSLYIPSFQMYYYDLKDKSFEGQYAGKNNYRIGLGFDFYPKEMGDKLYIQFMFSYRHYEDIRVNFIDDSQPFLFANNIHYDYKDYYRVFLIQANINRRYAIKRIFADVYIGIGLRTKQISSKVTPYSNDYLPIIRDWQFYEEQYSLLNKPISIILFPSIQIGLSVGIK
jgi:hypothetical protein